MAVGAFCDRGVLAKDDETGRSYTEANADEAVTIAAARAELPPITFTGVRDLAV